MIYQRLLSSLWFWMIYPQISVLMINEPIHFGHWIKTSYDDTGVDYYTFKWKIKVSKKDCVHACKAVEACEYNNLDVRSHLCALVKVKDDREGRLPVIEIKPGYIYMNKSEWNMDKVPVISKESDESRVPGGNHTVNENKNTDCGIPKGGDFKGNMLSTGGKILLKCRLGKSSFLEDFEFVRSTCAENGTWTNPFICQPYFNGSYYYIQETSMSWHEAKSNCESMSGHLVDINSYEEQAFVVRILDDCGIPKGGDFKGNMLSTGGKILLKCRLGKSSFLEDFEFVRSTCAENGTWTNPFICQPYFNGSYYYIQETSMSWHEAKSNCESMSGHLVDINSYEEQAFVVRILDASNLLTFDVWTGGNDLETEGIFLWSDGSPVPINGSWNEGDPNNYFGQQHCMELAEPHTLWNDMVCGLAALSICEFP